MTTSATSQSPVLQTARDPFATPDALKILVKNAAFLISGWNTTAKIVNHISKNYPFVKQMATFISALLFRRFGPISAVGTVAILAAVVFASIKIKKTYSSVEFKGLLLKKHLFPPNTIVTGDLDLSHCTGITSLPKGLNVGGKLNLSGCT